MSPAKSTPKKRNSNRREVRDGRFEGSFVEVILMIVGFVDRGKKNKRGTNTGKPAVCTNVAIYLLFPPLSKYSLPKRIAAD